MYIIMDVEGLPAFVLQQFSTLSEDDGRVGGLETVLLEAVKTVSHPHRPSNAAINLLLFVQTIAVSVVYEPGSISSKLSM